MIPQLEAIKRILRFYWDPIGVAQASPEEHDGYALHIYTILHQGASEQDIASYLSWAAAEHMGLGRASDSTDEIAAKFVQAHQNKERLQ